jgi:hypothetical protein
MTRGISLPPATLAQLMTYFELGDCRIMKENARGVPVTPKKQVRA